MPRRRISDDEWEEERMIGGQQRNAANARERARMRVLSKAFCRLKTTLPWVPADTKLSKLDTLRLATSYIAHLRTLLCLDQDEDVEQTNNVHPLNLTWPFTFQPSPNSNGSTNGTGNQYDTSPWSDHHHNQNHQTHNHHNTPAISPMISPTERNDDRNNLFQSSSNKHRDIDEANSSHFNHNNNSCSTDNCNDISAANSFHNNMHSFNHSKYQDSLLQIG